jgi:SpoVK/Ycf46/Vps4 family AAA+-type ATPase
MGHDHHHHDSAVPDAFQDVVELARPESTELYDSLVGLDDTKRRLRREATVRLQPHLLDQWSERYHGRVLPLVTRLTTRPCVFVFSGDVGTGKTALAESFGSPLAESLGIPVVLYRLSLAARGSGLVGEMTALIGEAFDHLLAEARGAVPAPGQAPERAFILVVDEADTVAQSRESEQMHHEDRAGVNALIRGIDALAADRLPVMVVLCTNRGGALDPAVQRRAIQVFPFSRPDEHQRRELWIRLLDGLCPTDEELDTLAARSGAAVGSHLGYTYSDLVHTALPIAMLDAFPDQPLTVGLVLAALADLAPTPQFGAESPDASDALYMNGAPRAL